MSAMDFAYFSFAGFLVLATLIPFLRNQHWTIRWFDFVKVHTTVLALITFLWAFVFVERTAEFWGMQWSLLMALLYNGWTLFPYTPWYRVGSQQPSESHSDSVTLLSANVLQFNTEYDRFIKLVQETKPDIVMTMESNQDWDDAMSILESEYSYLCKVPLENTYGIHLYSKLPMTSSVHYFVADDLPSIEASVKTRKGYRFTLFCVHPPPPSPTEEANSKERDGELLSVAKKVRKDKNTTVIVGDFNNVAWSRASVLFRKTSETIDPRIGRGLISTFHAKYRFLRFPIDQLFHTPDVFIQELKALSNFGSDHLPLFSKFYINRHNDEQEDLVEELEKGEMSEVNEMIADGVAEESDRYRVPHKRPLGL